MNLNDYRGDTPLPPTDGQEADRLEAKADRYREALEEIIDRYSDSIDCQCCGNTADPDTLTITHWEHCAVSIAQRAVNGDTDAGNPGC